MAVFPTVSLLCLPLFLFLSCSISFLLSLAPSVSTRLRQRQSFRVIHVSTSPIPVPHPRFFFSLLVSSVLPFVRHSLQNHCDSPQGPPRSVIKFEARPVLGIAIRDAFSLLSVARDATWC